jgi:hypothetical protein
MLQLMSTRRLSWKMQFKKHLPCSTKRSERDSFTTARRVSSSPVHPTLWLYSLGGSDGRKNPMGGTRPWRGRGATMTMPMAAATDAAGWRTDKWDGDNASRTMMISSTIIKTTSNKKYDEEGWMGSSSRLATLLRRIGGGPPQMGTRRGRRRRRRVVRFRAIDDPHWERPSRRGD